MVVVVYVLAGIQQSFRRIGGLRCWLIAVAWLCIGSGSAEAWQWGRWSLRLQLRYAMGWDDNVRRLAIPPEPEPDLSVRWVRLADAPLIQSRLPPATIQQDGIHQFSGQLSVLYRSPQHVWSARYALGGKLFFLTPDENSLIQNLASDYYFRVHRSVLLGVSVDAKDQRRVNTSREFSYFNGLLRLVWLAPLGFQLHVQGGYLLFHYRNFENLTPDSSFDSFTDGQRYSFHGDLYNITLQKSFGRIFRIFTSYQFSRRMFGVKRKQMPRTLDPQTGQPVGEIPPYCSSDPNNSTQFLICSEEQTRHDLSHRFTVGFRLLYKVLLEGAYHLSAVDTDSHGESYIGHSIQLTFAATPFWKIYIVAQLQLQFRNYFTGTPFDPNRGQTGEDDNLTALTIRISRPLWEHLYLDLRYSLYANLFGLGINQYSRNLLTIGFSLSF